MHSAGFSTVRESPGPPMMSFISPIRIDCAQPPLPCVVSQMYWLWT